MRHQVVYRQPAFEMLLDFGAVVERCPENAAFVFEFRLGQTRVFHRAVHGGNSAVPALGDVYDLKRVQNQLPDCDDGLFRLVGAPACLRVDTGGGFHVPADEAPAPSAEPAPLSFSGGLRGRTLRRYQSRYSRLSRNKISKSL